MKMSALSGLHAFEAVKSSIVRQYFDVSEKPLALVGTVKMVSFYLKLIKYFLVTNPL